MKRPIRILVAVLLVASTLGAAAEEDPIILAHYMPWFKMQRKPDGSIEWAHWQWFGGGPRKHNPDKILENGQRDIASVYYPLIGPYEGLDPIVLEYHMLTAKAAGIEGFIVDWYGPPSHEDDVFRAMVKAAEKTGMKVAICLEEKGFFPPIFREAQTRADAQDRMERYMRYVLKDYAPSEAYLRFNGKPVFMIFNGYGQTRIGEQVLSPGELKEVLDRVGADDIVYVRCHFDPQFLDVTQGCYAWCGDTKYREWFYPRAQKARLEGKIEFWAGSASPGFDDRGVWGWGNGPRFTDRRGTQEYVDTWLDTLRWRPDAVQIVTWNDFEEGTTIEPAREYGFKYLNTTEEYVGKLTGRGINLKDNEWPHRLYQLRRDVDALFDPDDRRKWNGKLDDYARDFCDGRRFFMGWRLKRLEKKIGKLSAED